MGKNEGKESILNNTARPIDDKQKEGMNTKGQTKLAKKSSSSGRHWSKKPIFKYALIAMGVIVSIFIILGAYTRGYPQYFYNYIRCGTPPIAVTYYFAASKIDYSKPGDENYPDPNLFTKYVCTEQEAIDLGALYVPAGMREDYIKE